MSLPEYYNINNTCEAGINRGFTSALAREKLLSNDNIAREEVVGFNLDDFIFVYQRSRFDYRVCVSVVIVLL